MKSRNILALDFGEKKIGVAWKKSGFLTPQPLENIKNQGDVIYKVYQVVLEKEATLIVVGYPLRPDGTASPITRKTEKFVRALQSCLSASITVRLLDERYSTQEVRERLRTLGKSDRFFQKHKDAYSAVRILERFLEVSEE